MCPLQTHTVVGVLLCFVSSKYSAYLAEIFDVRTLLACRGKSVRARCNGSTCISRLVSWTYTALVIDSTRAVLRRVQGSRASEVTEMKNAVASGGDLIVTVL